MPKFDVTVAVTFEMTDLKAVETALALIQAGAYIVDQEEANTVSAITTWLQTYINGLDGMSATDVTVSNISITNFLAAVAGTESTPSGTNGSFTFTVAIEKGASALTTVPITGTIKATPDYFKIEIDPSANGTVTADKSLAAVGETITLTITPDEGYELEDITIVRTGYTGGVSVPGTGNTRTFVMPGYDVTIAATFADAYSPISVISKTPDNGATNVFIGQPIIVTFSGPISGRFTEGYIKITDPEHNEVFCLAAANGDVLRILHNPFTPSETYTVTIPKEAIKGLADDVAWSFTTEALGIGYTLTPALNATGVALNATVSVDFGTSSIAGSSLAGINITASSGDISTSAVVVSGTNTVLINHDPFAPLTTYTVTIPVGAINGYPVDIIWQFTTQEQSLGIVTRTPASGATGVALNAMVYIEFDASIAESSFDGVRITAANGD